ncbi:MAG: hypothetical protein WDM91_02080 [Rhizomicrobium sp.]
MIGTKLIKAPVMTNNEIWVVVATDTSGARILANKEGSSSVIARVDLAAPLPVDADQKVVSLLALRRPAAVLARQIMPLLVEGAVYDAYEGLVVVASREMARELRLIMDRRVFNLMIAEIVEDTAAANDDSQRLRSAV